MASAVPTSAVTVIEPSCECGTSFRRRAHAGSPVVGGDQSDLAADRTPYTFFAIANTQLAAAGVDAAAISARLAEGGKADLPDLDRPPAAAAPRRAEAVASRFTTKRFR